MPAQLNAPTLSAEERSSVERFVQSAADAAAAAVVPTGLITATALTMATNRLLGRGTAATGAIEEITLGTNLSFTGTTLNAASAGGTVTIVSVTTANGVSGAVATDTTTPAITLTLGAITPSSVAATGAIRSNGTAGVGYATGAGGTVTQATSKATNVTLNKPCGEITMNNAALAAGAIVSFSLVNSTIAITDHILMTHQATGAFGAYLLNARCVGGGATISVRNTSAASLSEAIVLRFVVIKGVNA